MMKILLKVLAFVIFIFSVVPANVQAQTLLNNKERKQRIEKITSDYKDWTSATWQGKLKSDMLPLTVTMKVFLEKDKNILLSFRAFIGEVLRIEIDKERVLVVNKFKKRYWEGDIKTINLLMPSIYESIQSMLIGRGFIIGEGELSVKNAAKAEVYDLNEDYVLVAPLLPEKFENYTYGFALNNQGKLNNVVMSYSKVQENPDNCDLVNVSNIMELLADITYTDNGKASADVNFTLQGVNLKGTIEADPIEWDVKGFSRIEIGNNYRRCSFKECLSF